MNGFEQRIIQLAEAYKNPEEFIYILEKEINKVSPNEKGDCFLQAGNVLYKFSFFVLARNIWSHALNYFDEFEDKDGKLACYGNLAVVYQSLGNYEKAIEYLENVLKIYELNRDRVTESICCTNLGVVYRKLGNFRKSIEYHKKSLKIAIEIGDMEGVAICYTNLGINYHNLGNFREAIEYHNKSLKIAIEIGDMEGVASCYTNLGITYHSLGNFREAIEYHKKSLELAIEIRNKAGESKCYGNLGLAHYSLGDFKEAIWYQEQSLKIAKVIKDKVGEANSYTNLGIAYQSLADFKKAIKYYEKSLEIANNIMDKAGESRCYINLGIAHESVRDFKITKQSLDNLRSEGIPYDVHRKLEDIINIEVIGEDEFLDYLKKTIGKEQTIIYKSSILKHSKRAIEYLEQSLKITKEIGDKVAEADCYTNLGIAYDSLGDLRKVIEHLNKSLEIAKYTGDKAMESRCYANLGVACRKLGDLKKAVEYCEKSLEIIKKTGDIVLERYTNLNLGLVYYDQSPQLAYNYLKHSIELSETIGKRLIEQEHKIGYYGLTSDAFQSIVPLCFKLKLKREEELFEYVERSKSKAFLDLIANTTIMPSDKLIKQKSLLEEEEANIHRLREVQKLSSIKTENLVELNEMGRISEKLNKIYDEMERLDPEYVLMRRGRSLPFANIKNMLSTENRDVVLVEYFIIEENIYISIISSKGLYIEAIQISEEKLRRYIEAYWREVVQYPFFGNISDTWIELSTYLIEPVSRYLDESDLIYFIPYSFLHYIPMHVLELHGEPLIKNHSVCYSPSASLIRILKDKGSKKLNSCLSFGVVFEDEAKKIAELFNGEIYTGKSATIDKVKDYIDNDIIHFSCHGRFDNSDPLSSGVLLYNEKILTAREILKKRLNTELVTLSACQTALNMINPGDELIGLTRAFLYAGAPSVLVSLWSVDAKSTEELMLEFYSLLKNGKDKATALQEAQKKIMEKEEYSHPYYWAPFILVGDWE